MIVYYPPGELTGEPGEPIGYMEEGGVRTPLFQRLETDWNLDWELGYGQTPIQVGETGTSITQENIEQQERDFWRRLIDIPGQVVQAVGQVITGPAAAVPVRDITMEGGAEMDGWMEVAQRYGPAAVQFLRSLGGQVGGLALPGVRGTTVGGTVVGRGRGFITIRTPQGRQVTIQTRRARRRWGRRDGGGLINRQLMQILMMRMLMGGRCD